MQRLNKNAYSTVDLTAHRNAQMGIKMGRSGRKVAACRKKTAIGMLLLILVAVCGCAHRQPLVEPDKTTEPGGGLESFETPEGFREPVQVRVGSLKGPTSLGLLFLMDKAQKGETTDTYVFRMAAGADELVSLVAKGELDMALVPANVASILYERMEGGVAVVDLNTLGVLYLVSGASGVESVADLEGKTIYLTGKGTTPEAVLNRLCQENGLQEGDYHLEFRSEPSEVAALLAGEPLALGLLPQPFATAAMAQNASLDIVLDLDQEWRKLAGGEGGIVTGVTLVRREFLEEHEEAVQAFLEEHALSVAAIKEDVETGAAFAVEAGIMGQEPVAQSAIPRCNIACVTGEEMKEALSAYLSVLWSFEPQLVGGTLPGEDFYFIGEADEGK